MAGFGPVSIFVTANIAARLTIGGRCELTDSKGKDVVVGRVVAIKESRAFPGEYIVDLEDSQIIPTTEWEKRVSQQDSPPKAV